MLNDQKYGPIFYAQTRGLFAAGQPDTVVISCWGRRGELLSLRCALFPLEKLGVAHGVTSWGSFGEQANE